MSASGQEMNCEEFREAIAADPSGTFAGAGHAGECDACAAYMADMRAFDARIGKAMAIDVPSLTVPELPPIDAGNTVPLPGRKKRRLAPPTWLGLAATVAIAAFLGLRMIGRPVGENTLAADILEHIDHEPGALVVTNVPISDARFTSVVNPEVGWMDRDVGLITYAQSCVIRGNTVPHLVMQGEKGPITLILLPDEKIDGAIPIKGESVDGVILPVGDGSIAVVGERDEALKKVEEKLVHSVEWRT